MTYEHENLKSEALKQLGMILKAIFLAQFLGFFNINQNDSQNKGPDHLGHRTGQFWQISGGFGFF